MMSDEKTVGIYTAALEKYGGENQRIVALEELAELQQALCKDLRGNHNAAHIAEEIAGEEEPGNHLTEPDGDYCQNVCGSANSCRRLKEGGGRCRDAERYDRLRRYENTGWEPEEIAGKGRAREEIL